MKYELAIIGGGPAGYTAGIYASRSGIKCILFDKGIGGGLVSEAPVIENYTAFPTISGIELIEKMKNHAEQWVDIHLNEEVIHLKKSKDDIIVTTARDEYRVKAIIICTGTKHRVLELPGESDLRGRGVSYCATCDGVFFKDKQVVVIGGGNSALIEAVYLHQIGCKVTLIHRRDVLRGEAALEQEAREKGITLLLNTVVKEIRGKEKVKSIIIQNLKTNDITELPIAGVFVSIGEIPQSSLAEQLKVDLTDKGYIKVDAAQRTNIQGVYAAGDVTGGIKQIITACSQGAIAALTSTESLGKLYPYY